MDNEYSERSSKQEEIDSTNTSPQRWSSEKLLQGHPEAIIVHEGEVYRLRCTRNNKLIPHK
jgi:hemin uptake protein HemP